MYNPLMLFMFASNIATTLYFQEDIEDWDQIEDEDKLLVEDALKG